LDASAGVKSTGFGGGKVSLSTTDPTINQPIVVGLKGGGWGAGLPPDLTNAGPWCLAPTVTGSNGVACQSSGNTGLDAVSYSATASGPAAVDGQDSKAGYTDNWNFTISRQMPWSSIGEISYIGNRSEDLASQGNGGSAGFNTLNINLVPVGAINAYASQHNVDPNTLNADTFRTSFPGYSDLYVATHNAHSNYNALQAIWARTKGRYTVNLNYTFSKAEGTVGFFDQFNVNNNFGVLPNSRKQLFNAAYSVELPKASVNKFVGGAVNGWQVTGVLQLESGPNLSGYQGENFGMGYTGSNGTNGSSAIIPGSISVQIPNGIPISNVSLLGTPDIQLNPILTCNPTSGLKAHQYINGNCFQAPTGVSQNGSTILPPIYGPAYFNWDMGLFKNFAITESQKLQFRFNFYNFLNHPLWSFNGNNLNLSFLQSQDQSTITQNNANFGYTTQKQGHRIIEMGVKYYF